ncbi:MAG TPA: TIGR03032 family protein [Saprospiraceae bacterium]|nr:TIGR03032 family protein [Saprospiraceae bacterium]HMQ84052.1 TIGR03032 family protein [Saprospiraceae bacterium]
MALENLENSQALAPFSCRYSPNIPELLRQLNCTLAISTYQAGKVIFLSAKDDNQLIQLPRTFKKPMGIALKGQQMAIATLDEVLVLANSPELAWHYPPMPQQYDALYMPRATYYTGMLDLHDLEWSNQGLIAVNTSFSCICLIDDTYSFKPIWQPPFITKLAHEDRCHLNGLALHKGQARYVTAFNQGDISKSWRENITTSGILMDMDSQEIIASELPMPHTPRIINDNLLVLFSATGELVSIHTETGKWDSICQIDGFVRGMDHCGDYLFIGLSRLRKNSSTFAQLPLSHQAQWAGIAVVHLPTGALVGMIQYLASVDEIYDIRVLSGVQRPNILNTEKEQYKKGVVTPDATYWAKEV